MNEQHSSHGSLRQQPLGEAFLALLERDQMRLLRLCTALEKIADGLPVSWQNRKTAKVLAFLDKAFTRHVFIHEKCVFPLIRSLEEKKEFIEPVLRQLEFEHAADHGLIFEITSAFIGRAEGGGSDLILGYLLRSFFDNCRRHCVWEHNVLYSLVRKHLAASAPRRQHDALFRISAGLAEPDALPRLAV